MADFSTITYDVSETGVARITLNKPETRNAQNKRMLYEINDAFDLAGHDTNVKVVVMAAAGPHFSSGHDLRDQEPFSEFEPVTNWGGFDAPGQEGHQAMEEELYLGLCWRWRNFPKPTIAEVQGKVIAAGLMLVWVCDIIIASEEATFSDPVVAFGVNGVEYFAHPWEFGTRKAKELLFTGGIMSAAEAKSTGMVNHVVEREELTGFVTQMADRIAKRPAMGLRLAKQSVNQAEDAQGLWTALNAAMSLQQLGHANARIVHGMPVDPEGAKTIREDAKAG
ncbi:MAG: enoyl-CoA hydratase [Pseudomonadales bacterium]|nr:enoyl-CoA hydratase [Pseudomonadales bacterium]